MYLVTHMGQKRASQMRILVLIASLSTTLFVWPPLADPINVPKMVVLTILSAWILGSVISHFISSRDERMTLGQWAVVGFATGVLIAGLLTDVKYTAFFGALQRNDGAFSYMALAVLSFAAMMSFASSDIRQIRIWLLVVGVVLTIHGSLQTFGHDPFSWVLLYNPVIGTLGNPDFFSGIMAAAAIASFWLVLVEKKNWVRGLGILLLLVEIFLLKRCGSMQGLAAFGVGFSILAVAKIWQIHRRMGIIACVIVGLSSLPAFFGILNKGPLASRLYRGSVQSRIDYWHAALGMFKSHPFAGIGLDRFGENYGQFAPRVQIVPGQMADNAHNVFLQLAATGGLLVILPYLFLIFLIFSTAIRTIKNLTGGPQLELIALFSIWFSLLLISSISVDNLGVAVWFWVTGGALYGISRHFSEEGRKPIPKHKSGSSIKQTKLPAESSAFAVIVSFVLSVLMLIVMVPAWRSSSVLMELQRYRGGWSKTQFVDKIHEATDIQPSNIQLRIALADISLRGSLIDLGLELTKSIIKQDPRSRNGNYLAAIAYEMAKKYELAIPYRLKLMKIDQWNTNNMYQLATDYIQVKDLDSARKIASRISQLYPNSAEAKTAEQLVKG